jgi:hypothetical protein
MSGLLLCFCRYHPGIIGAHTTKEVNFFNKRPEKTANATLQRTYFGSFPSVDMSVDEPLAGRCSYPAQLGLSSSSRPALVRMEATAMYLAHPSAAGNIQRLLPQVRPQVDTSITLQPLAAASKQPALHCRWSDHSPGLLWLAICLI